MPVPFSETHVADFENTEFTDNDGVFLKVEKNASQLIGVTGPVVNFYNDDPEVSLMFGFHTSTIYKFFKSIQSYAKEQITSLAYNTGATSGNVIQLNSTGTSSTSVNNYVAPGGHHFYENDHFSYGTVIAKNFQVAGGGHLHGSGYLQLGNVEMPSIHLIGDKSPLTNFITTDDADWAEFNKWNLADIAYAWGITSLSTGTYGLLDPILNSGSTTECTYIKVLNSGHYRVSATINVANSSTTGSNVTQNAFQLVKTSSDFDKHWGTGSRTRIGGTGVTLVRVNWHSVSSCTCQAMVYMQANERIGLWVSCIRGSNNAQALVPASHSNLIIEKVPMYSSV